MGNRGKLRSGLLGLAVVLGVGGFLGGCGYDQVVHTWVAYSEESSVPEGPKLPGHMYLVRGLTSVYSFGIDQLAAKVNHRGVTATVYTFQRTCFSCEQQIAIGDHCLPSKLQNDAPLYELQ